MCTSTPLTMSSPVPLNPLSSVLPLSDSRTLPARPSKRLVLKRRSVFSLRTQTKSLRVVEYSELPKETAKEKERDGRLAYRCANIAQPSLFTSFLESMAEKYEKSP